MKSIDVAIVEDDPDLRESLKLLFDEAGDFTCSGMHGSAEDALRRIGGHPPDVLLLDIQLPGERGSRAVRRFVERFPKLLVVMLTMYADEEYVFEALCNGASGYLLKKTPPPRLLDELRGAVAGGSPISPEIARKVVTLFRRFPARRDEELCDLTPQERRFLELLSRGYSYQAAADALEISVNTVRNHVRAIYEKLHVHSRSEAVGKALRQGLL